MNRGLIHLKQSVYVGKNIGYFKALYRAKSLNR